MMTVFPQSATFLGFVGKTLGLYALIEAASFALIAPFWHGIMFKDVWGLYQLFLSPAVAVIPLIYYANQAYNRPKAFAIRFALAMAVFFVMIAVAMHYSNAMGRLFGISSSAGKSIFVAVLCGTIAAVAGYRKAYKLALSKRTPADA